MDGVRPFGRTTLTIDPEAWAVNSEHARLRLESITWRYPAPVRGPLEGISIGGLQVQAAKGQSGPHRYGGYIPGGASVFEKPMGSGHRRPMGVNRMIMNSRALDTWHLRDVSPLAEELATYS